MSGSRSVSVVDGVVVFDNGDPDRPEYDPSVFLTPERQVRVASFASGGGVDDTASINAAALAAAGGTLVFSGGPYKADSIELHSDTQVVFEGGTSLIPTGQPGRSFFTITGSDAAHKKNISIIGARGDGQDVIHSLVSAVYVDGLQVRDSVACDLTSGSLVGVTDGTDITVSGCNMDGGTYGVLLRRCSNASVVGNVFRNCKRDGVLSYDGSEHVSIVGNTVVGFAMDDETGRGGIHAYGSTDLTVAGNFIKGLSTTNTTSPGIRLRDAERFSVTGNTIVDPPQDGILVVSFNDFSPIVGGDGTIAGNTILNPGFRGIAVSTSTILPVAITGNRVKNLTNPVGGSGPDGVLVNAPGCVVSNNVIDEGASNGVVLAGKGCIASGNYIRNMGKVVSGVRVGIWVTSTDCVVVGNVVEDNQEVVTTQRAVRVNAGASAVVAGNHGVGALPALYRMDGTGLPFDVQGSLVINGTPV